VIAAFFGKILDFFRRGKKDGEGGGTVS
jgi:hypothetical protein